MNITPPLPINAQKALDAAKLAAEDCLKVMQEIAPVICVENKDGEYEIGIVGELTTDAKHAVGKAIRHALAQGARSVVLTTEAWLSTIDKEKSPALFQGVIEGSAVILPPKHDPERREAIVIQLYTPDRQLVIGAEREGARLKEWSIIGDTANTDMKFKRTTF